MSNILKSTSHLIYRHGISSSFISVSEGTYDVETGSATNIGTTYTVKLYKNHIRANQYRFPNLIDKDIAEFYVLATDLTVAPKQKDKIVYNSVEYVVDSFEEHIANGMTIMYSLIGVKS